MLVSRSFLVLLFTQASLSYSLDRDGLCFSHLNNSSSKFSFNVTEILQRPRTFLWDTWVFRHPVTGLYLRYALSAPDRGEGSFTRHREARIRVFSSKDGKTWRDRGLVVNNSLTWSGHTAYSRDGKVLLFHTKSKFEANDVHQKIAVAESKDGVRFSASQTLIDPRDPNSRQELIKKGYYLDTYNGLISGFRDPYFFNDTLYFATRKETSDGKIVPAIGRIRYPNQDFTQSPQILPPMEFSLGKEITEMEVPNIRQLPDGRYLLSVNLTNRKTPDAPTEEVNSWVRLYVANSEDGPWSPARGPLLDQDGSLTGPLERIYGFNLETGTEEVVGSGFMRTGGQFPHAITPRIAIQIDP